MSYSSVHQKVLTVSSQSNKDRVGAERSSANCPVVLTKTLQLTLYCKGVTYRYSFGHLGQQFIAGIVKHFVHCHLFIHSPPGQAPLCSVSITPLPICVRMFYLQYYVVAMLIHIESVCSQTCAYTVYTHSSQYRDAGGAERINKLGQH